jgi:hypothetical protein
MQKGLSVFGTKRFFINSQNDLSFKNDGEDDLDGTGTVSNKQS